MVAARAGDAGVAPTAVWRGAAPGPCGGSQHRRLDRAHQAQGGAQGVLDAVALPLQAGAQEAEVVAGGVELAQGGRVRQAGQRCDGSARSCSKGPERV